MEYNHIFTQKTSQLMEAPICIFLPYQIYLSFLNTKYYLK